MVLVADDCADGRRIAGAQRCGLATLQRALLEAEGVIFDATGRVLQAVEGVGATDDQ